MAVAPIVIECPGCCGSEGVTCGCAGINSSTTLYVTGSHTGTLTWNGTLGRWQGTVTGPCTLFVCVYCNGDGGCEDYGVSFNCVACDEFYEARACTDNLPQNCSCSPFQLNAVCYDMVQSPTCCNGVDVDLFITE